MLKAFVEKLQEMDCQWFETDDNRHFSTRKLHPVVQAQPEPLSVHTLDGIVEYYKTRNDNDAPVKPAFAHVEDFRTVHLVSRLYGKEKQRDCFVTAQAYEIRHRFGAQMQPEEFIVWLQAGFVQDENVQALLRVVGNMEQGISAEYVDDGVTQRVTARAGVARREIVELPNPVELRPYRTFPDIEQPASRFVLRIAPGKDGAPPTCALHEADGGAWRDEAVLGIKQYLADYEVPAIG